MAPDLERSEGQVNEAFAMDEDSLKKAADDTGSSSASDSTSKKKGKKGKKSKKEEKENTQTIPDLPPVSFFTLFRFATPMDYFLIFLAVLGSCGTGVCFPIMLILFGDITNTFVGGGLDQETIDELTCNVSAFANVT